MTTTHLNTPADHTRDPPEVIIVDKHRKSKNTFNLVKVIINNQSYKCGDRANDDDAADPDDVQICVSLIVL